MNPDSDEVLILIPTLNEAPTIGGLIEAFSAKGFSHILVVDGHSRDKTPEIARAAGATVVSQTGKGKGEAIRETIPFIDRKYVLMIDGDGTYSPDDAEQMLSRLADGYDHVIGNRLIEENSGAFSRLNFHGNMFLNRLFRLAHGKYLSDILSGYRAFTRASLQAMQLHETGFGIETEITAEAVRNNQKIAIVPVKYVKRPGSATKLHPFHDGLKIATTIYRLAKANNPLFFFGLIGIILIFAGIVTGTYVLIEWFRQVTHIPMTILTMLLIVVGFEIFMFGVISDLLLSYHRELLREVHEIQEHIRSGR